VGDVKYEYNLEGNSFQVYNHKGEKCLIVPKEETAKKLCIEFNSALQAGKDIVLESATATSRRLREGYLMVEMGTEIHRQLKELAKGVDFFLYIIDPETKRTIYYDPYGSVVLENKHGEY
jgi:hypothetical protein